MVNTIYAKILSASEKFDLKEIYKLRYEVFVEEKNWIDKAVCTTRMEVDTYDQNCTYITLNTLDENGEEKLIGISRVIPLTNTIMLDKDFKELVENVKLKRETSLEITRLTIARDYRHLHLDVELYKNLFKWSGEKQIDDWYFVVEPKYLKYLNRLGIEARQIGANKVFPDGVEAIAVHLNLPEVMIKLKKRNEELYLRLQ